MNDYPAMIDQVNHVELVPQQVRARLADEPSWHGARRSGRSWPGGAASRRR